jgi:hypothetical protein
VAYSGELDIQKQAADVMAQALKRDRIELVHVIGPGTKHSYHPESRDQVEQMVSQLAARGRERMPLAVHFTTYTLRYNQLAWLTVDALDEHWKQAIVDGDIHTNGRIELRVENVNALTVTIPPGGWPFRSVNVPRLLIADARQQGAEATEISGLLPPVRSDLSWSVSLHREGNKWTVGPLPNDALWKKPGLQGPIDDAFMDAFVFVRPTGRCRSPQVDSWVHGEMDRAIEHWRRHFRGHPRVKDDKDITDEDIAGRNLVLWGDPASNSVLARIADRLPLKYEGAEITAGERRFSAEHHAPILVYPNPLNRSRYVVVNSSFTFREYTYLNNARQVPVLPDWAIIDPHAAECRLAGQWPRPTSSANAGNCGPRGALKWCGEPNELRGSSLQKFGICSPPCGVMSASNTFGSMFWLRKRTDPSTIPTLAPPGETPPKPSGPLMTGFPVRGLIEDVAAAHGPRFFEVSVTNMVLDVPSRTSRRLVARL